MAESTPHTSQFGQAIGNWASGFASRAAGLWLAQFLLALYACLVVNLVFGISVGSAVNVLLAMQIFWPFSIAAIYFVGSILVWDFSDLPEFLTTILAYILNPFAAILGFSLYAYFDGTHLAHVSFVYAGYMDYLHGLLLAIAHLGNSISIPHVEFIGSDRFFRWSNFIFGFAGLIMSLLQRLFRQRSGDRRHAAT